jgi:hypothetical protein
MNFQVVEDQLSLLMTRAMTLHAPPSSELGSFAGCKARFNGTGSNKELRNFILHVTLYKDAERISDDTALQELPQLLEGVAATWWTQTKENIYSWPTAIEMITKTFTQKRAAYEIYAEIFADKQDSHMKTEMFIRQKRLLLAELPHPHPEDVQIDMIYSLLKSKVQKRVPRNSVVSIDQLIKAVNSVEQSKDEERVGTYVNNDIEAMKIASQLKERCSRCRKSIRSGQMKSANVDCYKCNLRRAKRNKALKPETINHVYAPLQGFDPNINPFIK